MIGVKKPENHDRQRKIIESGVGNRQALVV
jgi:hypothetical protein